MPFLLATGRFRVNDQNDNLVDDKLYVNQILKVEYSGKFICDTGERVRKIARMRAYLKHGKGMKVRQILDIVMKKYSGVRKYKKRKKKRKSV